VFVSLVWKTRMNSHATTTELQIIRRFIDGVDTTIALLLVQRRELTHLAIEAKTREGMPIVDRAREDEIQENYEKTAPGSDLVVQTILWWCRGRFDAR
jgi:chorismate mutase